MIDWDSLKIKPKVQRYAAGWKVAFVPVELCFPIDKWLLAFRYALACANEQMVASRFATPIPERNWFLKVPE